MAALGFYLRICSSEECGTDNACVISELCNYDFSVFLRISCINLVLYECLYGKKERISSLHTPPPMQSTSGWKIFMVFVIPCGKVLYVLVNNILSSLIACSHSVEGCTCGNLSLFFSHLIHNAVRESSHGFL